MKPFRIYNPFKKKQSALLVKGPGAVPQRIQILTPVTHKSWALTRLIGTLTRTPISTISKPAGITNLPSKSFNLRVENPSKVTPSHFTFPKGAAFPIQKMPSQAKYAGWKKSVQTKKVSVSIPAASITTAPVKTSWKESIQVDREGEAPAKTQTAARVMKVVLIIQSERARQNKEPYTKSQMDAAVENFIEWRIKTAGSVANSWGKACIDGLSSMQRNKQNKGVGNRAYNSRHSIPSSVFKVMPNNPQSQSDFFSSRKGDKVSTSRAVNYYQDSLHDNTAGGPVLSDILYDGLQKAVDRNVEQLMDYMADAIVKNGKVMFDKGIQGAGGSSYEYEPDMNYT